jgi:prepilin-type N-terminal cleavage/methylation domain-containing protein
VVKRRATAGFTLLEIVVAMAIFGLFIFVMLSLTMEMVRYERKLQINFLRHPQIIAVIARMRRDVLDAYGDKPYEVTIDGYENTPKTLVLESLHESGSTQTIVWDFSTPGVVLRRAYKTGEVREWVARGVPPEFNAGTKITDVENQKGAPGVRLIATDTKGRVEIDQIFLPRTTQ